MSESLLLEAHDLSFAWGEQTVLRHVSFKLHKGEILTLIGPNGAGKSTLLKLALGLLRPTGGTLWRKPDMVIGYMPQKLEVDASLPMTARRFIELGLRPDLPPDPFWLDQTGVSQWLDRPLQGLSGGQLQRTLLCRALLRQPDLLVLDEPLQGVDVQGQAFLYRLLAEARERIGCAILMVSHDLHLVMAQTDQVLCLNGHVCCSGTPESVQAHPAYRELFGLDEDTFAIYRHHHDPTRCDHDGGHHD
ncbi:ATP-binding cassette domain-containing protein [Sulfurivirga sp.]|uniref:ATP-binding cassette domain-containing protein n=1 Tax=Sulfurivirga sp. TaxID=2614236 RepID=UPI0025E19034|nr:ATP-binding cassette domain-containing protein [Sulfurivirga sp.]